MLPSPLPYPCLSTASCYSLSPPLLVAHPLSSSASSHLNATSHSSCLSRGPIHSQSSPLSALFCLWSRRRLYTSLCIAAFSHLVLYIFHLILHAFSGAGVLHPYYCQGLSSGEDMIRVDDALLCGAQVLYVPGGHSIN